MSDPLGLISNIAGVSKIAPAAPAHRQQPGAPGFKEMLQEQIQRVNELQNDASTAIEDLAAGRRDDFESVMIATQKADIAFKMLLQVRNKVMDAYEELKQIRI